MVNETNSMKPKTDIKNIKIHNIDYKNELIVKYKLHLIEVSNQFKIIFENLEKITVQYHYFSALNDLK